MGSLKECAMAYEPPQTLNIADLDRVSVDIELKDGQGTDKEGNEFKYKYTVVNGKEYRVPGSVLGGIKAIMKKIPTVKYVSVIKDGVGMNTRYQVVPITVEEQIEG